MFLFRIVTIASSPFNAKAKKWIIGRKDIFKQVETAIPQNEKITWMHCASLGEFEQGRPLLEKIRREYPDTKLLLTFFSPSGYEVQKNYTGVDWVFYLPLDGAVNARRFLEIVNPSLVIFVKYEFWYYYLKKIYYRKIPLLLVSAVFRKNMPALRWMRSLQLKMLSRFHHIFLQNENSLQVLDLFHIKKNYSVAGDTRFDRVIEIAENFKPILEIEKFAAGNNLLIAGSTWTEDEKLLREIFPTLLHSQIKLVIAPHEISEKRLTEIKKMFPGALLYSQLSQPIISHSPCLIIDNFGMLSQLYQYAFLSYVGGGFRLSGVHNVTEAAVFGKPVLMGPNISKYPEAVALIKAKGGMKVSDATELKDYITNFLSDSSYYKLSCQSSYQFIRENSGAVQTIMNYIQENRLLTN